MKRGNHRTAQARRHNAVASGMQPVSAAEAVCMSGLFDTAEPEITRLTAAIAEAHGLKAKAEQAGRLTAAVSRLLACEQHSDGNLNCTLCRKLSTLRNETASLVIKMAG